MCCNCHNTCWNSCCGSTVRPDPCCGGDNGATPLPIYPDQGLSGCYPVYVSVPAFLRRPVAAGEVVADSGWGCRY